MIPRLRNPRLWLLLAALALLAATFARLELALERMSFRYLFVFDITQSMNVPDTGVAGAPLRRLDFAKQSARAALAELPCSTSAGLAVFAGHRVFVLFTPVNVCRNFGEIATMLDRIDWTMSWEARSEISKGLFKGMQVAKNLADDTHLIFFSDGHEAPPLHAAYRPRFPRKKLHGGKGLIIGVGGVAPAPIPKLHPDGALQGYWQADEVLQVDTYSLGRRSSDRSERMVGVDDADVRQRIAAGTEHLSALHEAHLKQLAAATGLRYARLQSSEQLAALLGDPALARRETDLIDLRWLPALLALLLIGAVYIAPGGNGFFQKLLKTREK